MRSTAADPRILSVQIVVTVNALVYSCDQLLLFVQITTYVNAAIYSCELLVPLR